jgi:hypothetical protein
VLSALPVINFANCCCAWILFGGALAAYLRQQNDPEPIAIGDGALAGLFAGVIGTFVWAALSIPIQAAMAPFEEGLMQRALANAADLPPEARQFLEGLTGGPAIGIGMVFGFFVMLFVSSLFGMLGGIFGALFFRKKPVQLPPPIPGI